MAEAEAEAEPIDSAGDSVLRRRLSNLHFNLHFLHLHLHFNLHLHLKIFTWRSRYWKLCGEGSGRPPRNEEPREPPLESGRWVREKIFKRVRIEKFGPE